VSGINVLFLSFPDDSDTLSGFEGGVAGQILHISVISFDSGVTTFLIEHNEGTGTQDIFLRGGIDKLFETYGGVTLVCDGSNWYISSETN